MTPNFKNKALVTLKPDDDLILLQIYDGYFHRKLPSFLICRSKLAAVADGTENSTVDTDLSHALRIYRQKEQLTFVAHYILDEDINGRFSGISERFTLPVADVLRVLTFNASVTRFILKNQSLQQARIELAFNAHRKISELIKDPIEKRALSKAFRDNFRYGRDTEVFITRDFCGFFFEVIDGYCGGLIRHERQIRGRNGNYYKHVYYSTHT